MAWKELSIATRYIKRQFEKGVGKSIAKVLTELITNSDDSYKSIEASQGKEERRPILVILDRRKEVLSVVDQAEGLDARKMEECFSAYGAESVYRKEGITARSLFGKGLRDVLFTQTKGVVKSIKDNKSYIAEFRWRSKDGQNRPGIDIKEGPRVTKELRENWEIAGNGTRVEFILRDDIAVPQHQGLVERISNFYMLRVINANPARRVTIRSVYSSSRVEEGEITYSEPVGEVLLSEEFEIECESFAPIRASLEVQRASEDLIQEEHGYEERQGGVLVTDEDDNVLDLTLFSYDRDPAARKLFGRLRLKGIGEIIRKKLNAKEPEEILTETRDGFDRKHPLYQRIAKRLDTLLRPLVEKERRAAEVESPLSESLRKQHKPAFDRLSELYQKLVPDAGIGPGQLPKGTKIPETLAFAAPQITLTARMTRPVALLINPQAIPNGSEVKLFSTEPAIRLRPLSFNVDHSTQKDGCVVKLIAVQCSQAGLTGKVTAQAGNEKAELNVFVIDREVIIPYTGLAFCPDYVSVSPGRHRTLKLYGDISRLGENLEVELTSDNPNVKVAKARMDFRNGDSLSPQISVLDVSVVGTGIGNTAKVTAKCGAFVASATVKVASREEKPPKQGGPAIRGYVFRPLSQKVQTLWEQESGLIIVNLRDPLNKEHFGETPADADHSLKENRYAQIRLADLILDEALQMMVSKALESGGLETRFPDNPEVDMRTYVCEYKFDLGPEIHAHFVTPL